MAIETLLSLYRKAGHQVPELKSQTEIGAFDTVSAADWYAQNGYYRLAALGGSTTHTGKTINEENSLESAAFYGGVKCIAEDMGSLPWFLYKRSRDRERVDKAFDHPYWETLHDMSNPDTASGEFVEALTAHALVSGTGYARIERLMSGKPLLWPIMPSQIRKELNARKQPVFIWKDGNDPEKTLPAEKVFDIRGFTLNGVDGDRLVKRMANLLGLNLTLDEYAGRYFAQDATPGVILERPLEAPKLNPTELDLMKAAYIKAHQKMGSKFEPVVLQEGTVAKLLNPKAADAQLLESRGHGVIEVCRVLRLPPHRLADLTRATYSNIEQQSIEYAQYTLGPWNRRWRQAVYRCLLRLDERKLYYAEHEVSAILRGDFATQAEGFRKLLEKGVYSINEVRRWMNLNPIPGGDEHFIQINLATVQDVASGLTVADKQTGTIPVEERSTIQ